MATRQRLSRLVGWLAIAAAALVALVAVVQLVRLVALVAQRWPHGPGPVGLLAVVVLAALAAAAMTAPFLRELDHVRPATWLIVGLALAAGLRLLAAALIDAPLSVDAAAYRQMALDALGGQCCFGDRSPGLPIVLVPLYGWLGAVPAAHEAVNLVAGVAGGWLVFAIVRDEWDGRAAASALIGYALLPSLVLFTPVLLSEPLFTTIVLGMVRAIQLAARRSSPFVAAAVAGVLIAAAQYVRGLAPVLLLAAGVTLLIRVQPWRRAAMALGLMLAAFFLAASPIVVHNLQAHGELSIDSSSFLGNTLYIGTSQASDGRITPWLLHQISRLPGDDQWQRSQAAGRIGMRRVARHPLGFARLAVRKFPIMWGNDEEGVRFALSRAALQRPVGATLLLESQLAYATIAVGALVGFWLLRRRPGTVAIAVAVLLLATIGAHTFVEVKPRYHFWLIPLFTVMAAPALGWGLRQLGGRLGIDRRPGADGDGDTDDEVQQVGARRGVEHGTGDRFDEGLHQGEESGHGEDAQ